MINGLKTNGTVSTDTTELWTIAPNGDGAYAIAAINKDPEQAQTMELRMLDDSVTEMRIHTVNGPSTGSYNDIDRTEVGVTVSEWTAFTGSISLEPHSVNVIELR